MTESALVVEKCQEIERLLKGRHAAVGRGLGELAKSVEGRVPQTLIQTIWRVAGMRNGWIHDAKPLRDPRLFTDLCDAVIGDLQTFSFARDRQTSSESIDKKPEPVGSSVSATISSVWLEYNASGESPDLGLKIHADVTVTGLRERKCSISAFFMHQNGSLLEGGSHKDLEGRIKIECPVTPPYDESHYADVPLFIPYSALIAAKGTHQVYAIVGVFSPDENKWLASSGSPYFTLTIP